MSTAEQAIKGHEGARPQPLTVEGLRVRPTVSVEEGGAVLGLGRAASYAAAKRGDLPTIRIGRRLVVPSVALLRLLGHEA